ncbi:uncharacterized protein LOC143364356 [Halictus rubicundus]|uniref:uncharacterized protein LOC143364356 n=1 Tax=Halictus rubicundus TaxID=77578 RepID=UPI00403677D1
MPTILTSMGEFQERDSGWALSKILHLIVNCNKYQPLQAGCNVSVPREIQLKRAIVNVKSNDEACFFWAVVAGLYPVKKHSERFSSYPHYRTVLRTEEFQLPMSFKDIRKFERVNDVSVNVFEWVRKKCGALHLTEKKRSKHVNLMLLRGRNDSHHHYTCIRNLSRLVSSQLSKNSHRMHVCDREIRRSEDMWVRFSNYAYKERAPFVIYADLECLLEKHEEQSRGARTQYQHHHAFSIGYYMHCGYDASLCEYQACSREEGCSTWFATKLHELSCKLQKILDKNASMRTLTEAEKLDFLTATCCHVCEKPFNDCDEKVHDHCHITGAYRGPAHNACNLNYQSSYVIPVVFHNLSGYDAHFIIKELANAFKGKIDVLPLTKERYISFTKHVENDGGMGRDYRKLIKFRFIDSFKFLNSSLDKLSSYLDKSKLRVVRGEFAHLSDSDFNLLTRKGVFPYDYLTSYDKLKEERLPPREAFYNRLCTSEISDTDYLHANTIELELFTDVDMLLFVERGIRGGLSQCSHRYARANNKYLPTYDSSEPSAYLMYFDVNNLYGWAMSQPLPHSGFRWVDERAHIDNFNVESIPIDSPVGYILEVDLEYPREIHDAHADLPFCPSHDKATAGSSQRKLLATLRDKERYVLHYRYLQQTTSI